MKHAKKITAILLTAFVGSQSCGLVLADSEYEASVRRMSGQGSPVWDGGAGNQERTNFVVMPGQQGQPASNERSNNTTNQPAAQQAVAPLDGWVNNLSGVSESGRTEIRQAFNQAFQRAPDTTYESNGATTRVPTFTASREGLTNLRNTLVSVLGSASAADSALDVLAGSLIQSAGTDNARTAVATLRSALQDPGSVMGVTLQIRGASAGAGDIFNSSNRPRIENSVSGVGFYNSNSSDRRFVNNAAAPGQMSMLSVVTRQSVAPSARIMSTPANDLINTHQTATANTMLSGVEAVPGIMSNLFSYVSNMITGGPSIQANAANTAPGHAPANPYNTPYSQAGPQNLNNAGAGMGTVRSMGGTGGPSGPSMPIPSGLNISQINSGAVQNAVNSGVTGGRSVAPPTVTNTFNPYLNMPTNPNPAIQPAALANNR